MSTRLPVAKSVAVIVVPGVGDDGPGDTVRALADSLLRHPGSSRLTHAVADEVVVPPWDPLAAGPPSKDRSHTGARIRLPRSDGPDLVLYEMHWADLSRFPASLGGFLAALYGLLFQMSTTGLEALRPHAGPGGRPSARAARRLLQMLSWVMAVPLIFVTGGLILMMGAMFVTLVFDGSGSSSALRGFFLVVIAIGLLAGGLLGGRFMRRQGWGTRLVIGHPMVWGGAISILAIGATIWRFAVTGSWQVATSDALAGGTAWIFRPLWIAIGTLGTLTVIPLAALGAPPGVDRRDRGRAVLTALLSIVVSTVGLAVAGAAIVAAVGGPMLRVLGKGAWAHPAETRCLNAATDWRLGHGCGPPNTWAQELFGQALAPIVPTVMVVALLTCVALIMSSDFIVCFLRRGSRDQKDWQVAFDGAAKYLGGRAHGVLLGVAVVVTSIAIVLVWTPVPGLGGFRNLGGPLGLVGAGTSSLVVTILVLVKYLRSNLLQVPRRALDLPYDIATYIRNPNGRPTDASAVEPPRRKILRRYAALARFIQTTEHADVLVIASHSQGTMLTYAFLMGDRFRLKGEEDVLEGAWAPSPQAGAPGGPKLPKAVELITFGSPVRQTYAARFPCQYEDIAEPRAVAERIHLAADHITWTNLYCSGDYVGRSLWSPNPVDVPFEVTIGNVMLRERCIGGGDHTAYWGSTEVAADVLRAAGYSPH